MATFTVVCADYRCPPDRTREAAERRLDIIEAHSNCKLEHAIEEGRG